MKVRQWLMGAVVGLVLAGPVLAGDDFYLVKLINYDRKRETVMMSGEEYKTLIKNMKLEEKYFAKAVADVAKEWRADEANKGIAFPAGRLTPRSILSFQKFPSQQKADQQLSRLQDQEAKKAERAAEQAKSNRNAKKTKSKSEEAKEAEAARAADLVKAKVEEYLAKAGQPSGAEAAAAPAAEGAKAPEKAVEGKAKDEVKKAK